MIYLVSNQLSLFETDKFTRISVDDAIDILKPHKEIEFDTETAGLDPYTKPLLCSQYGIKDAQIVVDNTTIPIEKMRPILEDKDTTLLTWNGAFDLRFLYYNKIHCVLERSCNYGRCKNFGNNRQNRYGTIANFYQRIQR